MTDIRIKDELISSIEEECRLTGRDREDFIEDILRSALKLSKYRRLREKMMAQAETAGFADEDEILRRIS